MLVVDEVVLVTAFRRSARCVVASASDVDVVNSVQTSPSSQSKRYWCDERRVPAVGDPRPSVPSPAPAGELGDGGITRPSEPRSVAERARVGANRPVSEM